MPDFYHLSGGLLEAGSTILPGNWGRVVAALGWRHPHAIREMALESSRLSRFANRPSRLQSAFACPTFEEARAFRQATDGFYAHQIYRVSLVNPDAATHITDSRLCAPQGNQRADWADVYWLDAEAQAAAIPGLDWIAATQGVQLREVVTLSPLRIEERYD